MRLFRTVLVFAVTGLAAFGQTNAPANVRRLSLEDCIEMALKHNLDLQIDRYNPELQRYTLGAAYGPYDPALNFYGRHDHAESGSSIFGTNLIPGSVVNDNIFSGNLGGPGVGAAGNLPWGMTYNLQGNASDTEKQTGTNAVVSSSQASVALTLSQPLLKNFWIDSTRLTISVAKNRVKYSEQALRLQIMQTVTTLEQAYYDLIYDRENVVVQERAVELAERLVAENRKRLEVGALAPLDLQSAEAQAASSRAAVLAAKSQLGTQERLIKGFITDQYGSWEPLELVPTGALTAQPPIVNLQESWRRGLTQRPELLQAKLDVEKAGIQLKYNRNQLFPELDVFGTFGYNGSGRELSGALYQVQNRDLTSYNFGGQITIPLANISARNNYKSAKASLQQVVLTLKKLEQGVMIDVDNDIGTIRANFDQVQATRTAREYEEAALDAEQKKLESGKSTTYTVLQVQRDLTTARGNEIQALDNYNKSLSQLSLHEASSLERLSVKLEWK